MRIFLKSTNLIFTLDNLLEIYQIEILFFGLSARKYLKGYNKKNFRKAIIFMILYNDFREFFLFVVY